MGHMRIPTEVVAQRSRALESKEREYLFTQNKWAAQSFVSGDPPRTILEETSGEEVNPWDYFPPRVMRNVDYGIALGMVCHVTRYRFVDTGTEAGVILELFFGIPEQRGFYATKVRR